MDDVTRLKIELENLRAQMASEPLSSIVIGEYRAKRDRERQLLRRIAQLEKAGNPGDADG